ncbi:cyclopropane-fatty-acyl-phospholipid synthase [Nocardioides baekrokdamisoli]|uniref:Cyclopropane-fatty-acyl-phospholipid synthase n=1 Tax=Nocardioides baekrokdamisoli TaxID=1804624 RepID=A0A3G9IEY9_9ACTN|nr:cyclopropane-fatty-acyl-phospholipid synthase family protein [Nocardioides baekrokdamisoli]BBH16862.1 cyclopropane-fatty-acyl-phospholipid synthase [Nocardioides baekrokdamisoli]
MTITNLAPARVRIDLDPIDSGLSTAISARVARALFVRAVSGLDVSVHLEGRTYGRGGPEMIIRRPDEFFARLGRDKNIGFGEAYLSGAWDAPDLASFLTVLCARIATLVPAPLRALRGAVVPRPPRDERGAQDDTQRVIAHHYDLSNDLFALFLDPTLMYSAALFRTDESGRPITGDDLETAQIRKIDAMLDLAEVGEGTRLLEIGSGWGALAIRAARRGAIVRTITLSTEQRDLAIGRVAAAGLADRIGVELCDYRDVRGTYDAVISVEMIEAVGWRYWSSYFQTIDRVLAPGGRVAIQAITMPHARMRATRETYTWITKYIFPGGFLPSVTALKQVTERDTRLRLRSSTSLGSHYAETLRQWDQRFLAARADWTRLGFDETFGRLWHFYLSYSRAGFASAYLDDLQLLFTRDAAR